MQILRCTDKIIFMMQLCLNSVKKGCKFIDGCACATADHLYWRTLFPKDVDTCHKLWGVCLCMRDRDRHLGNEMEIIAPLATDILFSEGKFFIGHNFIAKHFSEANYEGKRLSFKLLWSFTEAICGLSFPFTFVKPTAYWGLSLGESSMFVRYRMQLSSKTQMPW